MTNTNSPQVTPTKRTVQPRSSSSTPEKIPKLCNLNSFSEETCSALETIDTAISAAMFKLSINAKDDAMKHLSQALSCLSALKKKFPAQMAVAQGDFSNMSKRMSTLNNRLVGMGMTQEYLRNELSAKPKAAATLTFQEEDADNDDFLLASALDRIPEDQPSSSKTEPVTTPVASSQEVTKDSDEN